MNKTPLASEASEASEAPLPTLPTLLTLPPSLTHALSGVTVDDVLTTFPGARIVDAVDPPMPAGHVELFEAGRCRGFPWLRVRPRYAVGRGEESWRAWLSRWVSPADLVVARARLARGEGIA